MKKVTLAVLLALLLIPSAGFAKDWGHRYGRGHHRHRTVVIRDRHHTDGAAIVIGVLGGIATGIILDRVLTSPPPPQPVYYPPPPAPPPSRDPYDNGYSDGYSRGLERGRRERYEEGRKRGYEEGYEDARAGRTF